MLTSELAISSAVLDRRIIVPIGFATDFASVPRLPLAYLLFGNVAQETAVVHDFLYSTGACPRKLADEVFAEASKARGIAAWPVARCGGGQAVWCRPLLERERGRGWNSMH